MTASNGNIDYTQPLATLLKIATSVAHDRAEHSQGAGWLTRGELDKEEYVRFLMMLYHVYDALEAGLEKHSNHPALAPTHNPTLLARAPSIASDIAYLLDVPEDSWSSHPLHQSLLKTPPEAFKEYVGRLRYLADEAPDPSPLLAHAYVRYLGDLSGGQTIRRSIAKAYVSDSDDNEERGTQFYAFSKLGGGGPAAAGDMRRIKDWFRAGMNTAGADGTRRKQAIAEEAVYAFDLNMGLFTLLRAPSNLKSASREAAETPLGNPNNSLPPTPPPELANGSSGANGYITASEKSASYLEPERPSSKSNTIVDSSGRSILSPRARLLLFTLLSIGWVVYSIGGNWGELAVWVRDRVTSIFG